MSVYLYNTRTRSKDEFKSAVGNDVLLWPDRI